MWTMNQGLSNLIYILVLGKLDNYFLRHDHTHSLIYLIISIRTCTATSTNQPDKKACAYVWTVESGAE